MRHDLFDMVESLAVLILSGGIMKKEISCTACGLCVPQCPMELNIPALLEKYNEIFFDSKPVGEAAASMMMSALNVADSVPVSDLEAARKFTGELTPGACIGCGHCMLICPVGIGVPALLHELAENTL